MNKLLRTPGLRPHADQSLSAMDLGLDKVVLVTGSTSNIAGTTARCS
jgi:hypothetical protein